jgi:hypothetical protein
MRLRGLAVAITTLTIALGAPTVATAGAAAAADDGQLTWAVAPADTSQGAGRPNFVYAADPGDVIEDAIVVSNLGTDDLTLAVYAADGLTTSSGQLDLLPAGQPSVDLGSWVSLETDSVQVAPGASVKVPFTVTVPDDATPGDHTGGVVTSFVSAGAGSQVALDSRLGSRMHLRVSGALTPALTVSAPSIDYHQSLDPFSASTATVRYTLTNTGNARIAATDSVRVSGPFGASTARTAPVAVPELLPGSVLQREVEVSGVWPLFRLQADVAVTAEGVGVGASTVPVVTASAAGWAVPWSWLVLIGLVVALAVVVPTLRDRRRAGTFRGERRGSVAPRA